MLVCKLVLFLCTIASSFCLARPTDDLQDKESKSEIYRVRRMIGGAYASIEEAPFVVQLIQSGQTYCTGAIIDPETILTAAHCL